MPETFLVYQRAVDVRPLEDGLFAIFNDETSDLRRYFELVNLRLSPVAPMANNTAGIGRAGALALFRATLLTVGFVAHGISNPAASIIARASGDKLTLLPNFARQVKSLKNSYQIQHIEKLLSFAETFRK